MAQRSGLLGLVGANRDTVLTDRARRAATGAFIGFVVDFFDIYLPVVALAPALGYFEPSTLTSSVKTTIFYMVFAVTLIGRPLGAVIFGRLADVIGRRRTTTISIAGAGVATLITGLLPGWGAWGAGALALLLLLRLVGGTFMGGEYTSNNPLALEETPKELRGLVGGVIQSAYPVAYIAISVVTIIMLTVVPEHGVHSAYSQWGWRIPFFVGAGLVAVFLWQYRRVEESEAWSRTDASQRTSAPLRELFSGDNFRRLTQVFLLMSGLWLSVEAAISSPSALLIKYFNLPSRSVTIGLLVANVFLGVGYVAMGVAGQRFGRRRTLMVAGAWTIVVAPAAYAGMAAVASAGAGVPVVTVFATIQLVFAVAPWGIVTAYIVERFPTGIRSSGYGIGYSVAVVLPSFYSFYLLGLRTFMPYGYTPVVLLVLAGVLTLVGARMGPETREVDLTGDQLVTEATPVGAPRRAGADPAGGDGDRPAQLD